MSDKPGNSSMASPPPPPYTDAGMSKSKCPLERLFNRVKSLFKCRSSSEAEHCKQGLVAEQACLVAELKHNEAGIKANVTLLKTCDVAIESHQADKKSAEAAFRSLKAEDVIYEDEEEPFKAQIASLDAKIKLEEARKTSVEAALKALEAEKEALEAELHYNKSVTRFLSKTGSFKV